MEIEARFKNMNVGSVSMNQPSVTSLPAGRESFLFKANADEYYKDNFLFKATIALEYYNSTHEDRFELVDCLYMKDVTDFYWEELKYAHLSFIARSNDPSPKIKLFFAEVSSDQVVMACTPVEPGNPLFCRGCGKCHPEGVIYHPVGNYKEGSYRSFNSPPAGKMDSLEKSAKKWLNKNYIFGKAVENFSPGEHKELSKITNGYALEALRFYRMLRKGDYELSEILASVRFGDCRAGEVLYELDSKHFAHLTIDGESLANTCVNMTEAGLASYESETKCKACPLHCNMDHPKGRYLAGITEGIFADAQDKKGAWGVKVELQEKKVSNKPARVPVSGCDVLLLLQSGEDLPTCLPKGRPKKKLAAHRRGTMLAAHRRSKKNTSK
ncbi:hypothetical protein OROGR_003258 [Orobanche gracilis]